MPIPNGTTSVAELKDSLEVLTFDLYGTVVESLGRLHKRYRLVILSNGETMELKRVLLTARN